MENGTTALSPGLHTANAAPGYLNSLSLAATNISGGANHDNCSKTEIWGCSPATEFRTNREDTRPQLIKSNVLMRIMFKIVTESH
uniref:Uncharacterized protein n=1 Tax=Oryza punctata TaxID=4537 RepID=A0A0E0JYM0_ORYPU